ncbi:MAG: uracil-DNA glycosylase, partial [Methylococcales bacterium]
MDNPTRLQYLEAMGIDVWVPRKPAPVVNQTDSESGSTSEYLIQEPQVQDNTQQTWAELEAEVAG